MFKLDPHPTFPAIVQITQPGRESLPLSLIFKHKKATELQTFLTTANGRSDMEMLEEMIHSVDPQEKPSDMSLTEFLLQLGESYPASRSDLLNTYLQELTESRTKTKRGS